VISLANLWDRESILNRAYLETPSSVNTEKITPQTTLTVKEGELELPKLYDTVRTLDQTVDVDYYLPGCPPPAKLVAKAVEAIAKNELPPKGSVLAPERSVCDECPRKKEEKKIDKIYRVYEITPDPEKCLLEQGIICMGPATRGGCEAQCISANMPCTGCGGPCPNAIEQGSAMMSCLASIMGLDEETDSSFESQKLVDQVKDPIGIFYRYSLAHSILQRRVKK
jgi:F420-non-reducing hydrogenase small subunit